MEKIKLNDGNEIPAVGFGVFMVENDGPTYEAVLQALKDGYRHIDTAAAYQNETDVGKAIKDSGIPREDIFVTSKLWLSDYDNPEHGIERSLEKLGLDYIDLYLLHQPYGNVEKAWKALEKAQKEGKIKSIGVSNMTPNIWNKYVPNFETIPAINQVEFNPYFQQKELRKILDKDNVVLEAWYPLGHGNADLLNEPVIVELAEKYGKNPGQIILKFEVQDGVVTLPKSVNPERIKGNIDIFDFDLTDDEMDKIRALDTGKGSHNPEAPGVGKNLNKLVIED